jgi:VWFA-related protein
VNRMSLLLFLLPGALFASSANDAPIATYHSTVSEVRLTFFTTDENNRTIENVRKDDFAIVDGDLVVRNFRSLMRSNETAIDVLVMVDASESVAPRFQMMVNDLLQLLSQRQIASDDKFSVLSFGGMQPTMVCSGDCRSSETLEKILAVKPAGATPLFDALAYGAQYISQRQIPAVRPVIVLFSDGDDTISKISAHDALHALISSGVLLYAVDISDDTRSQGSGALQRMAEATGGRYFSFQQGSADVLQAALEDLRASYVVTYHLPKTETGFHSIRILPKHNLNLRFHCRSGYYYGANIP